MELKVQIKQPGKETNKISTIKLPLKSNPKNIKELLIESTKSFYSLYMKNSISLEAYQNNQFTIQSTFTDEEIEQKAIEGKISSFLHNSLSSITEEEAINTTIQGFNDGIIALFINKKRYEDMNMKINITGDEIVTFIKLTQLTGRLW